MFSEQYGKKDGDKMSKKKSRDEKDLKFDNLEDKVSDELAAMTTKDKDRKLETKYAPGVPNDKVKALSKGKSKTQSALSVVKKEKHLSSENRKSFAPAVARPLVQTTLQFRSTSFGLFEAANVMCNIVEISKDSTMLRRCQETYAQAPHPHPKPAKVSSKSSITSTSSQSGPFAMMKESEKKKKKSIDVEDDE